MSLSIGGMTCGSCAARIERRLNALEGVTARVNFASERARIVLGPAATVDTVVEEIRSAGFTAAAEPEPSVSMVDEGETPATIGTPATHGTHGTSDADERVRWLGRRLLVAALFAMPLCDASLAFSLVPSIRFEGWQWLLIALSAPVVTWCAWPFYKAAFAAARHGTSTMDTLVSIGIAAATGWSLYAMFRLDTSRTPRSILFVLLHQSGGAIYIDVAAGVTTFLLAGRYFEASSRRRTGNALRSLAKVAARDVCIVDAEGGTERRVAVSELGVGETFIVRPGETIATDGMVLSGRASVDRSAMTGESLPEEAVSGDLVLGGTVSLDGVLVVEATRVGGDTQLAHMLRLVEEAQNQKASVQRLADRISAVFVPVVLGIAVFTFTLWIVAAGSAGRAFSAGISVLIIACPCALGLATPAALLVASGRGARSGIFFKGYHALEASRQVDTVILDKTGTITTGRMTVTGVATIPSVSETEALRMAGAVENASEHLIAKAITEHAISRGVELPVVEAFVAAAGSGVSGTVQGHKIKVGTAGYMAPDEQPPDGIAERLREWEATAKTTVLVSRDGVVVAGIAISDSIRPSASEAVGDLEALGLRCILLSGDNHAAASCVGESIGVAEVISGASPGAKVEVIRRLQRQGGCVAMVGDGVNDAPALAAADLGLAVGSGTDVALNSADLIVVRDDLTVVATAISLARRTLGTIRANLVWAFAYNVVAIPLAACGLLNPLIAGAAMALSSGFVVFNSSRLARVGLRGEGETEAPAAPEGQVACLASSGTNFAASIVPTPEARS